MKVVPEVENVPIGQRIRWNPHNLGLVACRQGHRVRLTAAAGPINELMEAQTQLQL